MPPTLAPKAATVALDQTTLVRFRNVCTDPGGGKTLGFWSNKHGQLLVGTDDLAMLKLLNLRRADGGDFEPTKYAELRTWLLNGTAVNMAYMLSVQMAAMQPNVYHGLVSGGSLIHVGKDASLAWVTPTGFATVSNVLAAANASLGADGYTPSDDLLRD